MSFPVEYVRAGYEAASKTFDPNALSVDVSGKSYMITGANTGIGKVATMAIAKRGGTVHMLCQFPDDDTRKEIMEASGNKNVYIHVLDLSQSQRVYQFAKQFAESHDSLDCLINCAGCILETRQVTDDGLELCFAVNTMGPYILTTTLLPLLTKTEGARVVSVSSAAAYFYGTGDFSDLQCARMEPYTKLACYGQTKRQVLIMTEMWARAYPSVHFSAMHPGVTVTALMQSTMPTMYEQTKNGIARTPEQGADTMVWLAIAEAVKHQANGQYYLDRKATPRYLPNKAPQCTENEMQTLMDSLEKIAADIRGKAQ
ncbi:dehydrogenase/reductase SDR family member 12-like [Patiria miniata]|uniref:Uncharacterized protein n=1 Tax=Patiria miniata TaxID=46514 RepID=A0A913Z6K0_PATMI|nr:dehydrogenase/reductase SDR family member 12-like [Patiria miniata]